MIYRFMFVGYSKDVKSVKITADNKCYVALSSEVGRPGTKTDMVYMYVESNEAVVDPELLADGDLIAFPDGKKWMRAMDIFHFSKPLNQEQWARKTEKEPLVMMMRLKPDKVSSYIFYHYQYQEEKPGDGDRYGAIYLFGNEIIYYRETPEERETEVMKGLLDTDHSPLDRWGEIMGDIFAEEWATAENMEVSDYIEY